MKYAGYIGFCLVISLSLLYTTTASTSTKHRSSNRISSSSKHTKCTHTRASSHNSGEENPFDCQEPDTIMKMEWPELLGKNVYVARDTIIVERPDLEVIVVPFGQAVTMDFRTDRIRIFSDEQENVAIIPTVG